jgi:hypothetical protein
MPRPRRENRSTIAETVLTLRLSRADRESLDCLIEHQAKIATEQGFAMEPTVAAFLRSLIRREAQRLGIEARRDDEGRPQCVHRKSA